jgi:hypothetical protein
MNKQARYTILFTAYLFYLCGCSTPQVDRGPSNLSLGLMMVPTADGKEVYPAVMLVGDGMLLVDRCRAWSLIGTMPDGEPFFIGGDYFETDSFRPKLSVNSGVNALPEPTQGMGWSVIDPVWFGPKYDADLLKQSKSTTIRCEFSYLSRDYQLIEQRFEWQIHPEREPADSLIFISH